ncbi:MAG: peptidoglycan DD-metalloendopeptidase family protein [Vibrio sp.]
MIALCFVTLISGCSLQPKNDRGSYKGSYYEVKNGDSVYLISYLADKDVNDIIRFNHLKPPYTIYPGQKINLWTTAYIPPVYDGSGFYRGQNSTKVAQKQTSSPVVQSQSTGYVDSQNSQSNNTSVTQTPSSTNRIDHWEWPTRGRVISKFSLGDQGNKGIDIAGQRGQDVVATAAGSVVYAGNALRGYGNLIIIKHNDNYLSAYAHNDSMTVQEGQTVKTGQKIASMGSTGTNSVRLHFEIRYQGKSVNPESYLQ